ncbi:hypothetical protein BV898_12879 [Hypsibius exemplaris]|uniref:Uncharacterized protein n=1 Tax=Hypsibius exemplaris TaxID=2072580 RepID=A0A1W0WCG0_HYPEX|nr:hypothetical protein BV898_12879 [Hypsibius exemplaris]
MASFNPFGAFAAQRMHSSQAKKSLAEVPEKADSSSSAIPPHTTGGGVGGGAFQAKPSGLASYFQRNGQSWIPGLRPQLDRSTSAYPASSSLSGSVENLSLQDKSKTFGPQAESKLTLGTSTQQPSSQSVATRRPSRHGERAGEDRTDGRSFSPSGAPPISYRRNRRTSSLPPLPNEFTVFR